MKPSRETSEPEIEAPPDTERTQRIRFGFSDADVLKGFQAAPDHLKGHLIRAVGSITHSAFLAATRNPTVDANDLRQTGFVVACRIAERWDPLKGASFTTYVTTQARLAMNRFCQRARRDAEEGLPIAPSHGADDDEGAPDTVRETRPDPGAVAGSNFSRFWTPVPDVDDLVDAKRTLERLAEAEPKGAHIFRAAITRGLTATEAGKEVGLNANQAYRAKWGAIHHLQGAAPRAYVTPDTDDGPPSRRAAAQDSAWDEGTYREVYDEQDDGEPPPSSW